MRKSNGFTLIELLVVIAIIALLAAILFPVFARARENARRSSCASNLRQVSLGLLQYVQDHDERFPWLSHGTDDCGYAGTGSQVQITPYRGWGVAIGPYLKSAQIFQCPSDPKDLDTAETMTNEKFGDYFLNGMAHGRALASFAFVSNTILLGDSRDGRSDNMKDAHGYAGSASAYAFKGIASGSGAAPENGSYFLAAGVRRNSQRHLEGTNIAFVDGHVKWYLRGAITRNNPNTGAATFRTVEGTAAETVTGPNAVCP